MYDFIQPFVGIFKIRTKKLEQKLFLLINITENNCENLKKNEFFKHTFMKEIKIT